MGRPVIHRSLTEQEKTRLRRLCLRHVTARNQALALAEILCEVLDEIVQAKYDKAYHSGYTGGQKNAMRSSG